MRRIKDDKDDEVVEMKDNVFAATSCYYLDAPASANANSLLEEYFDTSPAILERTEDSTDDDSHDLKKKFHEIKVAITW